MSSKKIFIKNKFLLILFLISSFFFSGCSNLKNNSSVRDQGKPIAVTTFTILADLAKNVAGDRIEVRSITKPGAEIHTYQFTPSDLVRTEGAQLLIENGLGLEMWMKKFVQSVGDIKRVVLSEGIDPILIEGDLYTGKPNPHAWMSPKRTIHYVDKLVESFSEIDPEGSKFYINNGEKYKEKLLELDQELASALSSIPSGKRVLVSCEGAFSYLAEDYGMKEAFLWPVNSESKVTPRRMSKLISFIKEKSIPTIFCETTVNSRSQLEVARESGAAFGGNFFVDSLSGPDGPASTLLELQRYNVNLITKGLLSELED